MLFFCFCFCFSFFKCPRNNPPIFCTGGPTVERLNNLSIHLVNFYWSLFQYAAHLFLVFPLAESPSQRRNCNLLLGWRVDRCLAGWKVTWGVPEGVCVCFLNSLPFTHHLFLQLLLLFRCKSCCFFALPLSALLWAFTAFSLSSLLHLFPILMFLSPFFFCLFGFMP